MVGSARQRADLLQSLQQVGLDPDRCHPGVFEREQIDLDARDRSVRGAISPTGRSRSRSRSRAR
jgi:hypothetical protein